MFSLAKPIIKSLGKNQNLKVLQGFTNRVIPQTGFQSHARGNIIKQKINKGFYQDAIDIMNRHRVKVDVDKISELPQDGYYGTRAFADQAKTYGECKKMLPAIDTLIAERLRSQTSISTSLMQSLYSDMKNHVKEEVDMAEAHLAKLKEEADLIEDILSDLVLEHFWERMAIIAISGSTFIVCVVAVWAIKKSQLQQSECCMELTTKIETVLEQGRNVSRSESDRRATNLFNYDIPKYQSPSMSRALVVKK